MKMSISSVAVVVLLSSAAIFFCNTNIFAHCDTMSGPVIMDAKKALETKNADIILKWVKKDDEVAIKNLFDTTLKVRKQSKAAKEVADMHFFETLVRIHRQGEGASYTGIKPEGTKIEPIEEMSDKALEQNSIEPLIEKVTGHVSAAIREKFNKVMEAKKHMNESVEAGREYVEAYVTFIHYVGGIHSAAMSKSAHHNGSKNSESKEQHKD